MTPTRAESSKSVAGSNSPPKVSIGRSDAGMVILTLTGEWNVMGGVPGLADLEQFLAKESSVQSVAFDTQTVTAWDSSLLIFLRNLTDFLASRRIDMDLMGIPEGARRLHRLAAAVPERKDTGREERRGSFLARTGSYAIQAATSFNDMVQFVGEAAISLWALCRGRASFRRSDLMLVLQECGAQALPIVSLISFLVGLILAFVGAVQLMHFGAQIYVADLVGIAMTREMGAMMAAIIMAGRTGAAFAAQLGTMTVNQEIDALITLGISPTQFLVLPRMLALILMMPLLCLYADVVGMLGGLVVGVGMLDLTAAQYMTQTISAIDLTDIALGVMKGAVFGVLVALSGCLRGMQSGRSASAVGEAATSAVVTAIVFIIVTDAVFAVVTNILGI